MVGVLGPQEDMLATTLVRCRSTPAMGEAVYSANIAQLRRRLADENGGRDGAKLATHQLKKVLTLYRQRLSSLLTRSGRGSVLAIPNGYPGAVQRVREVVREMEDEVRVASCEDAPHNSLRPLQTLALETTVLPKGDHEVLRRSLEEAQRRCESLNVDMMHHSEANEELVETLGTVKDANKRLLEQIRAQTDEIAKITQERVDNEEQMDQLHRLHENSRHLIRQDAQRKVLATREAGEQRQAAMRQELTDKLRQIKAGSEILLQDVARLSQELHDDRKAFVDLVASTQAQVQCVVKNLQNRCGSHLDKHAQQKRFLEDSLENLGNQVRAEQEARHNEGYSGSHKHLSFVTEREAVQAHGSRELALHSSHAQAAERAANADKQAWAERRAALERRVEELMQQRYLRNNGVEQLQQHVVSLDSALQATRTDAHHIEGQVFDLKRKARESADALAAATSSNEHLRQQMQEQRAHFGQRNEEDLNESRQGYEQKAADARHAHDASMALARKQAEAMQDEALGYEGDLADLQRQLQPLEEECATLQRDACTWRTHGDDAKSSREIQEKDFGSTKHRFHGEKLKLQAGLDHMAAKCASWDEDIKRLTGDLQELRRAAVTKEHEYAAKQQTAASQVRDGNDALAALQSRIKDASEHHARLREEIASVRERALEIQGALQNGLESQALALDQERNRLGELLEAEKASSEQARKDLEHERDVSEQGLRRLQDEGRVKLVGAVQERQRVHERGRADIASEGQALMQQQRRMELLEHELQRTRTLLSEREASLVRLRLLHEQEERGATPAALRRLEEEVRAAAGALEAAQRSDSALTQHLGTQRRREARDHSQLGLTQLSA